MISGYAEALKQRISELPLVKSFEILSVKRGGSSFGATTAPSGATSPGAAKISARRTRPLGGAQISILSRGVPYGGRFVLRDFPVLPAERADPSGDAWCQRKASSGARRGYKEPGSKVW